MKTYRITIEKAEDADSQEWIPRVEITCDSVFTLDEDLVEWVTREIDPNAVIVLDPEHFTPRPATTCSECRDGNHEDCPDNGLSSAPYWCGCAARRHVS